MSVATSANTDGGAATWHAISADEVVQQLATSGEKGLDAAEDRKDSFTHECFSDVQPRPS